MDHDAIEHERGVRERLAVCRDALALADPLVDDILANPDRRITLDDLRHIGGALFINLDYVVSGDLRQLLRHSHEFLRLVDTIRAEKAAAADPAAG